LPERASARPSTPAVPEKGASKTDHPLDAAAGPHVTIPPPDVPLPQAKLNNSADVPANLLSSPSDSGSSAGSPNGPGGGVANGPATSESSVKGGGSNPEVGARSGTVASRGEPSVSAVIGPAPILPWWVDPETGLTWSLHDNGTDVTWDQALTYCSNLSSGGLRDWRFPEIGELGKIYDPVTERHIKGGVQLSQWWVWSGTTSFSKHAFRDGYLHGLTLGAYRADTQKALYFLFANGTQGESSLDAKRNLRALCVRGGGK
jgi:hypothetical protein